MRGTFFFNYILIEKNLFRINILYCFVRIIKTIEVTATDCEILVKFQHSNTLWSLNYSTIEFQSVLQSIKFLLSVVNDFWEMHSDLQLIKER